MEVYLIEKSPCALCWNSYTSVSPETAEIEDASLVNARMDVRNAPPVGAPTSIHNIVIDQSATLVKSLELILTEPDIDCSTADLMRSSFIKSVIANLRALNLLMIMDKRSGSLNTGQPQAAGALVNGKLAAQVWFYNAPSRY